jgi:hypothetical protein
MLLKARPAAAASRIEQPDIIIALRITGIRQVPGECGVYSTDALCLCT